MHMITNLLNQIEEHTKLECERIFYKFKQIKVGSNPLSGLNTCFDCA
jgi:hypothetical protein